MDCKECKTRTWHNPGGSCPKCAFDNEFGVFSEDNWNCETLNTIRLSPSTETVWNDDDWFSVTPSADGFVLLSGYKRRGAVMMGKFYNPDLCLTFELTEEHCKGAVRECKTHFNSQQSNSQSSGDT